MSYAPASTWGISNPGKIQRPIASESARVPFYALMVFTFILVVVPQGLFPVLVPFRIALVTAIFAAGSYVADRLTRRSPLTVTEQEVRLVFVLLGLAFLSVPTSYWPGGSLNVITDLYGKSIIIFLLLANLINTVKRLRAMLWLLTACSLVPALATIKNFLEGNLMQAEARVRGYLGGLTSNPNDVALTLNILIPLALGLLLATRSFVHRLILGFAIMIGTAGVIVTLSRGGFIFLVTTLVLYLKRLGKLRSWIVLFLPLLLFLMLGTQGFIDRMLTIGDIETAGSAQERWEDMKKALILMIGHPVFGVGIGQNILALNEMGTFWGRVHNVYLEIGAEMGIAALVVYTMLFYRCIRSVGKAERIWRGRGARCRLYRLAEGLKISLIGFAVGAMFHPVAYHFYFYYLAGLTVAVKVMAREVVANAPVPAA